MNIGRTFSITLLLAFLVPFITPLPAFSALGFVMCCFSSTNFVFSSFFCLLIIQPHLFHLNYYVSQYLLFLFLLLLHLLSVFNLPAFLVPFITFTFFSSSCFLSYCFSSTSSVFSSFFNIFSYACLSFSTFSSEPLEVPSFLTRLLLLFPLLLFFHLVVLFFPFITFAFLSWSMLLDGLSHV